MLKGQIVPLSRMYIPGVPEKFENKESMFNFWPLYVRGGLATNRAPNREEHRFPESRSSSLEGGWHRNAMGGWKKEGGGKPHE